MKRIRIAVGGFAALVVPFLLSMSLDLPLQPGEPTPSTPFPRVTDSLRTDFSDYMWPTEAARKMTSTFGEFRRTHFHGGVDIGTGSTTGYRVYASRDGYVSRIRVSPTGYGKMLYIRHRDGYYSTYAHLERFNAEIDARAAREQQLLERYPVDITCGPHEFPVKKGTIIAYTGQTGVGTPHLHFEIRDENLDPVNVLLCKDVNPPDRIPPTIRKVAIRPIGEGSTVNGVSRAHIYRVRPGIGSSYRVSDVIQVTGKAGLAIDVKDRSDGSWFRHGVYAHDLFIDGQLVYSVQLDRVPGEDAHQIALYYDWALLNEGRGRFQKLYMDSPNTLTFYSPRSDTAGTLNSAHFAEGPHEFRVVSRDFANNSSEVTGKILFNHPPVFDIEDSSTELRLSFSDLSKVRQVLVYGKRNASRSWKLTRLAPESGDGNTMQISGIRGKYDVIKVVAEGLWGTRSHPRFYFFNKPAEPGGSLRFRHEHGPDFVSLTLLTDMAFTSTPSVVVYEGTSRRSVALTAIDLDHYVGTFRPLEAFIGARRLVAIAEVNGQEMRSVDEFDLYPVVPGTAGSIVFDDGNLRISHAAQSVFKTLFLHIEKIGNEAYSLTPANVVLNKGFDVILRGNSFGRNRGIFLSNGFRQELLERAEADTGRVLTAKLTRTLGDVSILYDDVPPFVSLISIARTSTRRPFISFRAGDDFSGVDYNEVKLYIDKVLAIPELDGENRRAFYQVTDPLSYGPHELTIRLKDKLGNLTEVERRFTVH